MTEENNNQYVVLARKYRPQNFDDLLGQEALVQTLTNAIKNNRLHHAYILTGIRGVGKTTTARIIAKALNCIGKDGQSGPTIRPCGVCENCQAIAAGRHIDIMELDAASRTGVDDIREILDGVRYKPTNARYKIYIIDEIHMLSKNAFNALLKTLEEPPSHVKFIFATTEIRKVPITVLSRCQRFDLQRLSIENLTALFTRILEKEQISAEAEALQIIAKAADGSARDGLSMLDQAISLGAGKVETDIVKNMIGLADRNQTFELFEYLVSGQTDKLLANAQEQYKNGANPLTILQDLVNITHMIAKAKIIPNSITESSLSENEKEFCKRLAPQISIAILSKVWQMLIKGISELAIAPVQIDAMEMVLIRIAYSANLPTPQELLNDIKKNSNLAYATAITNSPIQGFEKKNSFLKQPDVCEPIVKLSGSSVFNTPEELISYMENNKKILAACSLKKDVSIKEFRDGYINMIIDNKIDSAFLVNLRKILFEATGKEWKIDSAHGELGQTIAQKEKAAEDEYRKNIMEYPLVKAIMAEFKGAKIESLTRKLIKEAEDVDDDDIGNALDIGMSDNYENDFDND
ncbi:MAG: DNA polymerase III subunit gamma/tau [Alphaproteobacteria bacterium]|nr:DNA polymerase III subunit gamma/tau [Alphaproteobacteria bacterium]